MERGRVPLPQMFLKVCGMTRAEDAHEAARRGATAIGFVFWDRSPRAMTPAAAAGIVAGLPLSVAAIGVFVNETPARVEEVAAMVGLDAVQLHGDEDRGSAACSRPVVRSVTLADADRLLTEWPEGTTFLLDAADPLRRGGTGQRVDWSRAARLARQARVVLAGGLTPENVAEAIAQVRPAGVDVSSGVEASPGVKDVLKMARFLASARQAMAERLDE